MNRSIMNRKIIVITMVCIMLVSMCGSTCSVFANTPISKDETVYVITNSDGSVNDVIVSDHLVNDSKASIINDISDLKNIENVKGDEKFTQTGNKLKWDADGKDIFYQGKSEKAVPVEMNLSYRMNGSSYTGQEMQGRNGDFAIVITYSNNSESAAANVPFIVLSGMLMKNNNYSNLTINNGKIIDDGEKSIVVGMAAPGLTNRLSVKARDIISDAGLGNEVVITGHTTNFDVTDIMSIATNSIFDDIDMREFGDLDYDDQIKELDKGSRKLVDGSEKLFNGLTELDNKVPALQQGVGSLVIGSRSLADGTKQLKNLKSGLYTIANGQKLAGDRIEQIHYGLIDEKQGFKVGLDKIGTGANELNEGVSTLLDGSNHKIQDALDKIKAVVGSDSDTYKEIEALLGDENGAKCLNTTAKAAVNTGTNSIENGVGQLSAAADEMIAGFEGDSGILGAMHSLTEGTKKIAASIGDESAFDSLIGGAEQLAIGMEQLNTNTITLSGAIKQLTDGSSQVSDGMEQLYDEGIRTIVNMYNKELKGLTSGLEDTVNAGKNYKSFSQLGEGMDGSVKFIFKTVVGTQKEDK